MMKINGIYVVAAHHFRELTPGEQCINNSRPCEGISSLTELMSYAQSAKVHDPGVAHYGNLTDTESQQLNEARSDYLENIKKAF